MKMERNAVSSARMNIVPSAINIITISTEQFVSEEESWKTKKERFWL